MRWLLIPLLALGLAGCGAGQFVNIDAAGKNFPRAQYQILGKTRNDQRWIDKTIEAEVVGFGFKRPARRPASWDAPVKKPVVVKPDPIKPAPAPVVVPTPKPVITPTPVEKKRWRDRIKERTKKIKDRLKDYHPQDDKVFRRRTNG